MVGRKTSSRCANCRKRKIKCDLSRPSCSQCVKSQWPCPGYDTHSRFYIYEKRLSANSATASSSGNTSDSSDLAVQSTRRNWALVLHTHPVNAADTLRNKLVFKINQRAVAARFAVIPEIQLLQHIPRRVGQSRALDVAVNCICNTTSSQSSQAEEDLTPRVSYGEALCNLQSALADSTEALTSETLAAAILLQMYEQSVDHSQLQWLIHANGVIRMLQLRGPARIQNELDRSILQAQIGNIFFRSIRDRTDCFLADAEWFPIVQQSISRAFRKEDSSNAEFSKMILAGLQIPGILCRYEQVQSGKSNPTMVNEMRNYMAQDDMDPSILMADLFQTRRLLAEWRMRYQLPKLDIYCSTNEQESSTVRIQHASTLAVNAFSVMTDYMLANLFIHSSAELVVLDANCRQLIRVAKSELQVLRRTDAIAATQTAGLLRTMLNRIIESSRNSEAKSQHLQPVITSLLHSLEEDT